MNKLFTSIAIVIAITGCAPTVWDRPNTTPAEFAIDTARCQLMAEGMTPDSGPADIRTGRLGTDVAANFSADFANGFARGLVLGHTHDLCMQANGYVATR
jgi:hypothetical protein